MHLTPDLTWYIIIYRMVKTVWPEKIGREVESLSCVQVQLVNLERQQVLIITN